MVFATWSMSATRLVESPPYDITRAVNSNLERRLSRDDLDARRAVAHAPDVGDVFLTDDVRMFDVAGERSPFD